MPDELRLVGAVVLAFSVTFVLTPVAIRLAHRLDFHDQPNVDYKRHRPATPYLGGSAVLAGALAAMLVFGGGTGEYVLLAICTAAFWATGTLDDRVGLAAPPRLALEVAAAAGLWAADLGWDVFASGALDLLLTIVWVVGIVNAVNLLDNIDGSSCSVATVCAAGVAAVALVEGEALVAALALAVAGACLGFLPFNLRPPARIYLGDGGSMPLGFLLAASVMGLDLGGSLGVAGLLAGALLVGVPIFDTTLVTISRRRRGISLLTGGRDHSTHRLAKRLGTTWAASLSLGAAQALLCVVAAVGVALGSVELALGAAACVVAGCLALVRFETAAWGVQPDAMPTASGTAEPALARQSAGV